VRAERTRPFSLQKRIKKELCISAGNIFRRSQLLRVRRKHAQQIPGKLFKLAFLVHLMRLVGQERFVDPCYERSSGPRDRFVNVIGPDGNGIFFGFGLKIHIEADE
jgi:hypothetical protein